MPIYLQIIFSIAGACVSVCAVTVACLQWKLAGRKFHFDLFDRRLLAKDAIHGLGDAYINETTNPKSEAWSRFYKYAYCSRFLFPRDGADWIKEVYGTIYPLWFVAEPAWNREIECPVRDDQSIARWENELKPLRLFAGNLYQQADERLDPYLEI